MKWGFLTAIFLQVEIIKEVEKQNVGWEELQIILLLKSLKQGTKPNSLLGIGLYVSLFTLLTPYLSTKLELYFYMYIDVLIQVYQ
jgi:hypothetical protein